MTQDVRGTRGALSGGRGQGGLVSNGRLEGEGSWCGAGGAGCGGGQSREPTVTLVAVEAAGKQRSV